MSKMLRIAALGLVIACLFAGCHFTTNFSDSTGKTSMQAAEKVEKMLTALVAGDIQAGMKLLHPNVAQNGEEKLLQMSRYLFGSKIVELTLQKVAVNNTKSTSGDAIQETGAFRMELEDGTELFLSVLYLTDDVGEGFVSFQIILGLV